MVYLSSVYFVNQILHVSDISVAHHQEVYCIYTKIGRLRVVLFRFSKYYRVSNFTKNRP